MLCRKVERSSGRAATDFRDLGAVRVPPGIWRGTLPRHLLRRHGYFSMNIDDERCPYFATGAKPSTASIRRTSPEDVADEIDWRSGPMVPILWVTDDIFG